jgi:ribosome-associated toxin RatA of RatAB toxin-antitoxin module
VRAVAIRRFALSWQFTTAEHGSHVNVAADVQMQSTLLQKVVDSVLPSAVDDIMDAFAARARQRSGVPKIAATSATPPKV